MEEITDQINWRTNFKINGIPVKTLKQFKKYCEENCNDNYSVGIINLMEIKKRYEEIIPFISNLQTQINEIRNQLNSKKQLKTFGDNNG